MAKKNLTCVRDAGIALYGDGLNILQADEFGADLADGLDALVTELKKKYNGRKKWPPFEIIVVNHKDGDLY